jgi:hypothetical protein
VAGRADWRAFKRSALFARGLMAYFAALALLALATGNLVGAGAIVIAGALLQGLLTLFAVLVARTTVYTLTNRRLVLRIGVALNTCINLPLALIASADLRQGSGNTGDIAVTLKGEHRLGYAMLWPHARPWRLSRPQPDAARPARCRAPGAGTGPGLRRPAPVAIARRAHEPVRPAPVRPTPALEEATA